MPGEAELEIGVAQVGQAGRDGRMVNSLLGDENGLAGCYRIVVPRARKGLEGLRPDSPGVVPELVRLGTWPQVRVDEVVEAGADDLAAEVDGRVRVVVQLDVPLILGVAHRPSGHPRRRLAIVELADHERAVFLPTQRNGLGLTWTSRRSGRLKLTASRSPAINAPR